MTSLTCDAIFENGVFRPTGTLPRTLAEGQPVHLVVQSDVPDDILKLAAQVYEGLSDQDISEIENIATRREDFFKVNSQ